MKTVAFGVIWVLLASGVLWGQTLTREEIIAYLGQSEPFKGGEKAPVLLIEFSDFQCSYCRQFWQKTLPLIERKYIKTGKVKFMYRHFAVLGNHSTAAALAAECAAEQGKFWPYHDRLFEKSDSPLAFTNGKLKGYARDIKLRGKDFDGCLDSGKYAKKVEGETAIAVFLGARGTPSFLLNGKLLVGAQPFEVFEAAIEKEIQERSMSKAKP